MPLCRRERVPGYASLLFMTFSDIQRLLHPSTDEAQEALAFIVRLCDWDQLVQVKAFDPKDKPSKQYNSMVQKIKNMNKKNPRDFTPSANE